eukprot:SAG11_NODE_25274_length_361_cov_0.740458_2_plen_70_part_01
MAQNRYYSCRPARAIPLPLSAAGDVDPQVLIRYSCDNNRAVVVTDQIKLLSVKKSVPERLIYLHFTGSEV